jgi:hypothetical protein
MSNPEVRGRRWLQIFSTSTTKLHGVTSQRTAVLKTAVVVILNLSWLSDRKWGEGGNISRHVTVSSSKRITFVLQSVAANGAENGCSCGGSSRWSRRKVIEVEGEE